MDNKKLFMEKLVEAFIQGATNEHEAYKVWNSKMPQNFKPDRLDVSELTFDGEEESNPSSWRLSITATYLENQKNGKFKISSRLNRDSDIITTEITYAFDYAYTVMQDEQPNFDEMIQFLNERLPAKRLDF